jgi:hypothetical protein
LVLVSSEPEPDADLIADVESAFPDGAEERDPLADLVHLEIVVRLPGAVMPDGQGYKFGYRRVLAPEEFRMADVFDKLPKELARIMRMLEMSMRFH